MTFKALNLAAALALMASTAVAQQSRDDIIEMLSEAGYSRIEVSRTFLGSLKFEAKGNGTEREIILGLDGTIRRDRTEVQSDADNDDDASERSTNAASLDDLNDDLEGDEDRDYSDDDSSSDDSDDDSNDDSNDDKSDDHGNDDSSDDSSDDENDDD